MDMPAPKLVINLLSSFGGATHKTANLTNDIHFCATGLNCHHPLSGASQAAHSNSPSGMIMYLVVLDLNTAVKPLPGNPPAAPPGGAAATLSQKPQHSADSNTNHGSYALCHHRLSFSSN